MPPIFGASTHFLLSIKQQPKVNAIDKIFLTSSLSSKFSYESIFHNVFSWMITPYTHEIKTIQHYVLDLYYFSKQINKKNSLWLKAWNKYWKINFLATSVGQSIFSLCPMQQQRAIEKHLSANTFWEQTILLVQIHAEQK